MNSDQIKGIMDEVMGSAKRKAGQLTDNPKLQVEGIAQLVKGKVEKAWGQTKEAISDVVDEATLQIDAHAQLHAKTTSAASEEKRSVERS